MYCPHCGEPLTADATTRHFRYTRHSKRRKNSGATSRRSDGSVWRKQGDRTWKMVKGPTNPKKRTGIKRMKSPFKGLGA